MELAGGWGGEHLATQDKQSKKTSVCHYHKTAALYAPLKILGGFTKEQQYHLRGRDMLFTADMCGFFFGEALQIISVRLTALQTQWADLAARKGTGAHRDRMLWQIVHLGHLRSLLEMLESVMLQDLPLWQAGCDSVPAVPWVQEWVLTLPAHDQLRWTQHCQRTAEAYLSKSAAWNPYAQPAPGSTACWRLVRDELLGIGQQVSHMHDTMHSRQGWPQAGVRLPVPPGQRWQSSADGGPSPGALMDRPTRADMGTRRPISANSPTQAARFMAPTDTSLAGFPRLTDLGTTPPHSGNDKFPHVLALHWLTGVACDEPMGLGGVSATRRYAGPCWTPAGVHGGTVSATARKRMSRLRVLWMRVCRLHDSEHAVKCSDRAIRRRVQEDSEEHGGARDWWKCALACDRCFQNSHADLEAWSKQCPDEECRLYLSTAELY